MNKTRLLYIFSYATLAITWLLMAMIAYWILGDRDVPSITKLVSVIPQVVKPNELVTIKLNVSRLRVCHVTFNRILQSDDGQTNYYMGTGEREILPEEIGKEIDTHITFVVPSNIPDGTYAFFNRLVYSCNPAQRLNPIVIDAPKAIIKVVR